MADSAIHHVADPVCHVLSVLIWKESIDLLQGCQASAKMSLDVESLFTYIILDDYAGQYWHNVQLFTSLNIH